MSDKPDPIVRASATLALLVLLGVLVVFLVAYGEARTEVATVRAEVRELRLRVDQYREVIDLRESIVTLMDEITDFLSEVRDDGR